MIRRATSDDVESIARLYERSFATLDFLPVPHTLDEHRKWFARPDRARAAVPLSRRRVDEPRHRLGAARPREAAPARRFYKPHGLAAIEFTDREGNEDKTPDVRYEWKPSA